MITAIVFVTADVDKIPQVAQAISDLESVSEVYSVTGAIDLIVMVRTKELAAVADIVSDTINKVPGVKSTRTHVAFRTYSKHDLDAAFSIGD